MSLFNVQCRRDIYTYACMFVCMEDKVPLMLDINPSINLAFVEAI